MSQTLEQRLDAAESRAAITEVLHLYARGWDRRDEDAVRSCFWPESQHRHGERGNDCADRPCRATEDLRSVPILGDQGVDISQGGKSCADFLSDAGDHEASIGVSTEDNVLEILPFHRVASTNPHAKRREPVQRCHQGTSISIGGAAVAAHPQQQRRRRIRTWR